MIFDINYKFEEHGIYLFKTDEGTDYRVSFRNGDYTSVSVLIQSENTFDSEDFITIQTLKFILNKINIDKFIITIDDKNPDIRRRKLNILKRYLNTYEYKVIESPHLPPIGRGSSNTILNITQVYLIKTKDKKQKRYCTVCGTEDVGYKFCPNCGGNLQV